MLFMKSHGPLASPLPAAQSCGYDDAGYGGLDVDFGSFGYFFAGAPEAPDSDAHTAYLDALSVAMLEQGQSEENDSSIPPVFTYLGQFIDHDVTANTDRETDFSKINVDVVRPAARDDVVANIANLRLGALNLDSLYGGAVAQGPIAEKLRDAMRYPGDCAKLWLGVQFDAGLGATPLPSDPAGDLLRVGRLIAGTNPVITEDELRALPEPLRGLFVNEDDTIRVQRAVIGDDRNDENLIVAQVHLAFARLHNKIVDEAHHHVANVTDRKAVFEWARQMTTWHYQWLVANTYLSTICEPGQLARTFADGAPVYRDFMERVSVPGEGMMPLPLEFSVSAFRFGHSMVRASYDWNRFFGRPAGTMPGILPIAPFGLLFAFTGGAETPMPLPVGGGSAPRLPSHWGAEFDRLALPVSPDTPDRSARRIDTRIAPPLSELGGENDPEVLRDLARRNLRRGHRLNIPTAQACIEALNRDYHAGLPVLSPEEIASGQTHDAVLAGGFDTATPLWFYVLKEAELSTGDHLGPLGSRLVAETLAGLVIHDPMSFWHQSGTDDGGRWRPEDGVAPDGEVINGLPGMLRAAGML